MRSKRPGKRISKFELSNVSPQGFGYSLGEENISWLSRSFRGLKMPQFVHSGMSNSRVHIISIGRISMSILQSNLSNIRISIHWSVARDHTSHSTGRAVRLARGSRKGTARQGALQPRCAGELYPC
jgi:hypothetical protein